MAMDWRALRVFATAIWFVVVGCREPTAEALILRDTSGAEFFWSDDEIHRISGKSPALPTCEPGSDAAYGPLVISRFWVVIGGCYGEFGVAWWGQDRIVICDEDQDCPPRSDREFECRGGLCQDANTDAFPPDELTRTDMFELCFGEAQREPDRTFELFEDYPGTDAATLDAIADACGRNAPMAPCDGPLPLHCRDPE